ncbi:MAG: response regulator [Cyclobacteriaceae bacterium]|jgi:DNA-binding NarL/FixJ family response regulator|nr:response regulator [Flammeovirgaceae bacterium]MCZ8023169.1 response regulator [Cytophagales bacterium]MCZ8329243.1 response regulator [Cyclobacteriaceae bacterium]
MEKEKRVFLYESYEPSQRSTERYINSLGIAAKVHQYNNLLKAFEIAKNEDYDLAIIDVVQPRLIGLLVAEAFLKFKPATKILIITPFHVSWLVQVCYNLKFNAYFSKQDDIEDYKNALISLLNGKNYLADKYKIDIHQTEYPEKHSYHFLPNELKKVYPFLIRGFSCEDIAPKIAMRVEDVAQQRDAIYKMARVQTPAELIIYNYNLELNEFRVFDEERTYSLPKTNK